MSTFEIWHNKCGFNFFSDFFTLLVSKVEICRKYFLNKNSQKQPLCSLYCRGRQRLSTEHHCEVRHGTLRLSTTLATEGIFLSTNYTPQFNKKKVSAPDTDTEIGVWVRFQMPKPGFGRTLPRTLAPYFEIITCCLLLFITCLNFPLKIHFEILQGSQLQSGWWWKFGVHYYFNMQAGMWNLL